MLVGFSKETEQGKSVDSLVISGGNYFLYLNPLSSPKQLERYFRPVLVLANLMCSVVTAV